MANKIEILKQAKDGLDVLPDLFRYAQEGFASIDAEDLERLKWYGLLHRKATPGYFMLRLRIPNGVLTSEQMEAVAEIANRCGRGQADITTRQNIQLRWITIEDAPWVMQRLSAAGLTSQQSGADNLRNVVGCPVAGLHQHDLVDSRPLAARIQQAIIGTKDFSNLPRKFNISLTGCPDDCTNSQTHDLSFVPARSAITGRPGFNVLAGGALGGKEPAFAQPLDAFVGPDDAVDLAVAALKVFRDNGSRELRNKARLKALIGEWGMSRFRSEVAKAFGRPLERAGSTTSGRAGGDHVGIARQSQAGLNTVGCLVPVGRISGDQLVEFGRLAREYGSAELRLTVQQNVLITNIPDANVEVLLNEPLLQTFSPDPSPWMRSLVTCTGNDFCRFSLIDTKGEALRLAKTLDERYELDAAIRIQMSGCPHACGQHRIGDVGLLGNRVRLGDEVLPMVDVFSGGCVGDTARLAEKTTDGVLFDDLPETVVRQVRALRGNSAVSHRQEFAMAGG